MGAFAGDASPAGDAATRAAGGGAKNAHWRGILASILGANLATVNTTEGAAYGAALLAGVGAGVWPDVRAACDATVRLTGEDHPDPAAAAYRAVYPLYPGLYAALAPTMHTLGG